MPDICGLIGGGLWHMYMDGMISPCEITKVRYTTYSSNHIS